MIPTFFSTKCNDLFFSKCNDPFIPANAMISFFSQMQLFLFFFGNAMVAFFFQQNAMIPPLLFLPLRKCNDPFFVNAMIPFFFAECNDRFFFSRKCNDPLFTEHGSIISTFHLLKKVNATFPPIVKKPQVLPLQSYFHIGQNGSKSEHTFFAQLIFTYFVC